ncbi:glycosyltransferase [Flavihumibacter sp. CACIAM 22H1]|uniref:glycosyltransferase n=1 Tax=Flavihumibacter sp. CACIAM 22H1 TaxID=1812911 RepID=UPI0007A9311F|nr:glycosyltransferase [Flavihumibacter sp. CACIAM 22H1]KYP15124.1 MAG: hypothetical protein A1D16_12510 [Flavihumibacter sp. CACIAM 22H1]
MERETDRMDNKAKRICIVAKGFFPENTPRSFRATELAKQFAREGHQVTVYTNDKEYDYTAFEREYNVSVLSYGKLRFKPLRSNGIPVLGELKRKLGRLLFMLVDYPNIEITWKLKSKLKQLQEQDLLVSIAVPYAVHWGVAWARRKDKKLANVWVADCGDPFMGNTLESFRYPFYFSFLEKWFCRKVDYLTVPTQGAIKSYYQEFHHKIKVIPQGFNFQDIVIKQEYSTNNIPTFAYCGGIAATGVRSPFKLLELLSQIDRPFVFHIYATGGLDLLKDKITGLEDKVVLHKAIDRVELIKRLAKMDFLVNFDNGTMHQVPSKLIDYSLSGRPIMNIFPASPDKALLMAFLEGNYQGQWKIKNLEEYNITNVTKNFLELLNHSSVS